MNRQKHFNSKPAIIPIYSPLHPWIRKKKNNIPNFHKQIFVFPSVHEPSKKRLQEKTVLSVEIEAAQSLQHLQHQTTTISVQKTAASRLHYSQQITTNISRVQI